MCRTTVSSQRAKGSKATWCQRCEGMPHVNRGMRGTWSDFKGNEVRALRKDVVVVDEKGKIDGIWIRVRQKINEAQETRR